MYSLHDWLDELRLDCWGLFSYFVGFVVVLPDFFFHLLIKYFSFLYAFWTPENFPLHLTLNNTVIVTLPFLLWTFIVRFFIYFVWLCILYNWLIYYEIGTTSISYVVKPNRIFFLIHVNFFFVK